MLVLFEGSEQKDKMGDVMFKVEIVIMLSWNAFSFFFFFLLQSWIQRGVSEKDVASVL